MIAGKKILAVIPARGGSKGIPRKNIQIVAGKPLISWTILEAKKSKYLDRVILSSDDEQIIAVANEYGCETPFIRPNNIARDDTPGVEPVLHAIGMLPEFDLVALLQPTSPLRIALDIDTCIELCISEKAPACVSLSKSKFNPYWIRMLTKNLRLTPLTGYEENIYCRQDLPAYYTLNGAVYVADCTWLANNKSFLSENTIGYVMPTERSLDIDTEFDLNIFRILVEKGNDAAV